MNFLLNTNKDLFWAKYKMFFVKFYLGIASMWISNYDWLTFWLDVSDTIEDTIKTNEWEALSNQ